METYIVMSVVASISIVAFLLYMKFVARIESMEKWNFAVYFLAIAATGVSLSQFIPVGYIVIGGIALALRAAATITDQDHNVGL